MSGSVTTIFRDQRNAKEVASDMARDDFRFDKRIIRRNLENGIVTKDEYETHMKTLRDLAPEIERFDTKLTRVGRDIPTSVIENEEEDL